MSLIEGVKLCATHVSQSQIEQWSDRQKALALITSPEYLIRVARLICQNRQNPPLFLNNATGI
jgi:hypothetical protein